MKSAQIALKVDDGRGTPRELHIDENDVDAACLQLVNPPLQRRCKIVDFDPANGVSCPSLPDYQDRILREDIAWKPLQHVLRGLPRDALIDHGDRDIRVPAIKYFL